MYAMVQQNLYTTMRLCINAKPLKWKVAMKSLKSLKEKLISFDPATRCLEIYPNKLKCLKHFIHIS